MTLDRPAIIGIGCGLLIGAVNAALQIRALRQKGQQTGGVGVLVPGAVARQAFVVAAWWVAFRYANADKYWLTGSLLVAYTAPLLVQLKQMIFPKK